MKELMIIVLATLLTLSLLLWTYNTGYRKGEDDQKKECSATIDAIYADFTISETPHNVYCDSIVIPSPGQGKITGPIIQTDSFKDWVPGEPTTESEDVGAYEVGTKPWKEGIWPPTAIDDRNQIFGNYRIEQRLRKSAHRDGGGFCLETEMWQIVPIDLLASNWVFDGYDIERRCDYLGMKSLYDVKVITDSVKQAQWDLAIRFVEKVQQ